VVLKSGFASSITTVVDLETSDGVKIRSFQVSAEIWHMDVPGYNGTSNRTRVVSDWLGLPNMNGVQPDSLECWSVQVQISGRSDSAGGGAFPQWFSQPPYYLIELFALEGFIGLAHEVATLAIGVRVCQGFIESGDAVPVAV